MVSSLNYVFSMIVEKERLDKKLALGQKIRTSILIMIIALELDLTLTSVYLKLLIGI